MKRRLLFKVAVALLALVAAEAGTRVVLRLGAGIPLTTPGRALETFYPRLGTLRAREVPPDDGTVDLLLLGGSVLDERWSTVPHALAEEVERLTGRPVLLHIAAERAQMTRDSAVLYEALDGRSYDAVIVYHGINDVRAAAVSAERFEDTYGHLRRYRDLDTLLRYQHERSLALPYALARGVDGIADLTGLSDLTTTEEPPVELAELAVDHKTIYTVQANLQRIAEIAAERGHPLVLMTFATHHPDDYSHETFDARRLSYGRHRIPTEAWGLPDIVVSCVDEHNDMIEEVAAARDGVLLVDQAAAIEGGAEMFDDVCHLTLAGAQVFARTAGPAVRDAVRDTVSGTAGDQE